VSLAIGVDIGGTKVAAGVVDTSSGAIVDRLRRPTPAHDGEAMADTVIEVVLELADRHPVAAVGLGVPGFVNSARDDILVAPNLTLPAQPLAVRVREGTGLATILENDANAATWAEHRFGAAAGLDEVLMITAGTGIGGGAVIGGHLHRGAGGSAFEVGHQRVVPGGLPCGCGNLGCWEAYGSGSAMTTRARALVATGGAEAAALRERCGGHPEALTGAMITTAAQTGDPLATQLLAETGAWLGAGIASLVAILDPAVVVVGGGLGDAGELLHGPLRTAYAELASGAGQRRLPAVVAAELGNDAGIVGVADLAALDVGALSRN
jgi:glucokinase